MLCFWKKSYDKLSVYKAETLFADKGPSSQSYGFPWVMYKYESWTMKMAECWRIDAFYSKEIKSVILKGNQRWICIGKTDTEAEAPILWPPDVKSWLIGKDPDYGKGWSQKERDNRAEVVRWLNGHEFEQTAGSSEVQGRLACFSPWGHKDSDMTEWLNANPYFTLKSLL